MLKKFFISLFLIFTFQTYSFANQKLLIFVGAASKLPTEKIISNFEKETGIKVESIFGGSGYILSQMKLSKTGDIYFPGSSDYMDLAIKENLVYPESQKIVVYLVNAINVQRGNPKNIKTLRDLIKPNIKVAIANPQGVCVGAYAVEIIEKNFSKKEKELFKKNLVNYTESCDRTASVVALKAVDAVIGWEVFEHWNPEQIETIKLNKNEIIRIGYIPIAISKYTKNKKIAQKFIDYVISDKGKSIFKEYKYFSTLNEAEEYIGEKKKVGGFYKVPDDWLENK